MAVLHDNVAAYEQSLTCYRRMEALAERTRDRETFAMVANCIGVTLHRMGRYEDAIEAHLKHRKVATSTAAHIYALCNEGLAQRVLGNFSRAVLCHRHALDAALESNDVAGEGLASGHLGFDYTAWLTRAASVTAAVPGTAPRHRRKCSADDAAHPQPRGPGASCASHWLDDGGGTSR